MNSISTNISNLNTLQITHTILLTKYCIRTLIIKGNLDYKISTYTEYLNILKQVIKTSSIQANITNQTFIKKFRHIITIHTSRGYLFPNSVLEYICTSHNH